MPTIKATTPEEVAAGEAELEALENNFHQFLEAHFIGYPVMVIVGMLESYKFDLMRNM